jgi:hypothetical protein
LANVVDASRLIHLIPRSPSQDGPFYDGSETDE